MGVPVELLDRVGVPDCEGVFVAVVVIVVEGVFDVEDPDEGVPV